MAEVIREAGYTGFVQRLTWVHGNAVPVTAYLWGGGGAGGARAPTGSFTTSYQGALQQDPFHNVLVPNQSGYYIEVVLVYNDVGNLIDTNRIGYCVVVDGVVVYLNQTGPGQPDAVPPPTTVAVKTEFRGYSYYNGTPGPSTSFIAVECYSFNYTTYTSGGAVGGTGGGGAYAQVNFTINEGDILDVAVGQGGGAGGVTALASGITPGGEAGAGLLTSSLFNTVTNPASPPVYREFNPTYCTFLNNYGVWTDPPSATLFDRTYTVTFPATGNYQFTICSNGRADFYVDGEFAAFSYDPQIPWTVGFNVAAGARSVRIVSNAATGKRGAVALVIGSGVNYAGARGGDGIAGGGGAGGGGGATLVLKNDVIIGAAGGGGGGGAGGITSAGASAPGSRGQNAAGFFAGQNGTSRVYYNGGGCGGGGGGVTGGRGGASPGAGGDAGTSGSFGGSTGLEVQNPVGRTPGGTTNVYYRAGIASGGQSQAVSNNLEGNGKNGYAVFVFEVPDIHVKTDGTWNPVTKTFVKYTGLWREAKKKFIKIDGAWVPTIASTSPVFANYIGLGTNPISADFEELPPPAYSDGYGGFDSGGGGGGGKVICTALYELGYMEKEIFEYDQAYGLWLYQNDFVSYRGYRAWADILVRYVKGQGRPMLPKLLFWKTADEQQRLSQQLAISLARVIGGAFSKEIARRAGYDIPFSIGGWLCVTVGLSVNKAIGYVVKKIKKTSTIDYKE
jgi:hypothetical protein